MKKIISIVLAVTILLSMQTALAGGFGFDPLKVNFAGKEYYLAVTDAYGKEANGDKLPGELSIIPEGFKEYDPDGGFIERESGEGFDTLFFPATASVTFKKAYGTVHNEYEIHRVNLNFNQGAKTKNVILENGITELNLDFNVCSNLKTVVIPESIEKIVLTGFPKYGARYYTAEQAKQIKVSHGQIINDGGINNIVYVYSEIAKFLGLKESDITEKIHVAEYNDYYIGVKSQYEDAVNAYMAQFEMSAYAKTRQDLVFYVKAGSYAEGYLRSAGFNVKQYVSVTYNDSEVYSDQPAVIVGGRTLIPMRAAFEAMDATVNWDNNTRTVTAERGSTKISLAIGSNQLYVNGVAKTIDVSAQIINGRTMVPARAIAEAFGCDVNWNNDTKTAIIKE